MPRLDREASAYQGLAAQPSSPRSCSVWLSLGHLSRVGHHVLGVSGSGAAVLILKPSCLGLGRQVRVLGDAVLVRVAVSPGPVGRRRGGGRGGRRSGPCRRQYRLAAPPIPARPPVSIEGKAVAAVEAQAQRCRSGSHPPPRGGPAAGPARTGPSAVVSTRCRRRRPPERPPAAGHSCSTEWPVRQHNRRHATGWVVSDQTTRPRRTAGVRSRPARPRHEGLAKSSWAVAAERGRGESCASREGASRAAAGRRVPIRDEGTARLHQAATVSRAPRILLFMGDLNDNGRRRPGVSALRPPLAPPRRGPGTHWRIPHQDLGLASPGARSGPVSGRSLCPVATQRAGPPHRESHRTAPEASKRVRMGWPDRTLSPANTNDISPEPSAFSSAGNPPRGLGGSRGMAMVTVSDSRPPVIDRMRATWPTRTVAWARAWAGPPSDAGARRAPRDGSNRR